MQANSNKPAPCGGLTSHKTLAAEWNKQSGPVLFEVIDGNTRLAVANLLFHDEWPIFEAKELCNQIDYNTELTDTICIKIASHLNHQADIKLGRSVAESIEVIKRIFTNKLQSTTLGSMGREMKKYFQTVHSGEGFKNETIARMTTIFAKINPTQHEQFWTTVLAFLRRWGDICPIKLQHLKFFAVHADLSYFLTYSGFRQLPTSHC